MNEKLQAIFARLRTRADLAETDLSDVNAASSFQEPRPMHSLKGPSPLPEATGLKSLNFERKELVACHNPFRVQKCSSIRQIGKWPSDWILNHRLTL
jgi:hypothetical protein